MITYPLLRQNATIGVTAPSSGVQEELHFILTEAVAKMKNEGFSVVLGETPWKQHKAKSSSAIERAAELNAMMADKKIDIIIPPWGGELLIELLEHLDFGSYSDKWLLGYSDTSILLLAVTLATGIATAHGTNLVDVRGEYWDDTTAAWLLALRTKTGESIVQQSSSLFQKEWNFETPSPCVFHLTEPTSWKTASGNPSHMSGRLLGGCIDIIRHLAGTPYGDIAAFRQKHIPGEPIVWYFENCDLRTTDLKRSLVQLKLAGWFDDCSGLMFGRSATNAPVEDYVIEDVYRDLAEELRVPIIYDIDCGHVPPQMTFINGAYAEIAVSAGKGTVTQYFRP
ncbi:LD-carboxypeptidase [Paenibacillus sp. 1011MAR3C5]|uniref:S66 family peptidase n=1 Tax=Paenibacillus sp. 1011MAR3C5 TaxID=1675787 RepID=UPI000E6C5127|nr:S66 peptidase family protein [Paenibacillus sp. 1011MAR3C5]RJE86028.1 LD-carboxypeptidase [Paenibacillus sp. 1011MAR3C5]